jgi:DNA-binding CsgD family transcriptional regulator
VASTEQQVPAPALLERESLITALDVALEEARAGTGRLVFVGGEAGVGKTSLVRAFGARVQARLLNGTCDSLATPTPFGAFLDVASELRAPLDEHVRAGADARTVAVALLDELRRTSVLVLEDVHWADEATLDVLRVLGERVERTPSLVVATYREDEIEGSHPLRLVLGELASTSAVSRICVPRLTSDAVETLAAPHDADGRAVYELTQGMPSTSPRCLPPAPRSCPRPFATRCSGMLRERAGGIEFRHELARLAVERAVAPARRRTLHGTILAALASPSVREPDDARLAHHTEEAGDERAALRHARAAGARAKRLRSHREAAAQLARALRHAAGLPDPERAELFAAFAHEAHLTGRFEESIQAWTDAIALYRALGNRLGEGSALSYLTRPLVSFSRNAEAEEASEGNRLPAPEHRRRTRARPGLLDRDRSQHARVGARRDVRARAGGAASPGPHRLRGRAWPRRFLHVLLAGGCACLPVAVGRGGPGRARRPPPCQRADKARGTGRLRAGPRQAASVVRRRARVLAVEGGRPRRGARLDRRALPPPTRGLGRRGRRSVASPGLPLRGRARALAESEDERLLLEALGEFEQLGAQPAAKLVRQALRTRGAAVPRGPRPATRSNPAELTSRELDVLRLVAAGMRNAEVADELVLSRRTVDHHVSAILRKLSVRTRGEAAAAATRLGLLERDT